jgi:hypothetical protein
MLRIAFTCCLSLTVLLAACGPSREPVPAAARPTTEPSGTTVAGGLAADSGVLVVQLGRDTTIVERYVLHPDGSLDAVGVTRSPQTVLRRSTVRTSAPHRVATIDLDMLDPNTGSAATPTRRTRVTFEGDSAVFTVSGDQTRVTRAGGRPDMLMQSLVSPAFNQLMVSRALATPQPVDTVWTVGNPPAPVIIRGQAPGSIEIETPTLGTWTGRVDARGRIIELDMGLVGTRLHRADWRPDMDALARAYATRDAAGTGLGPLSPRDTARATIAGADVSVDYGRPAARGRVVFGGIVPWGEVWRTGANEATQLVTSRPLEIGGTHVPAGSYTLWTVPREDGWTLIINRRTGQWGTVYDAEHDLARIPMQVTQLAEPVERFTILIQPEGPGGALRLRWADVQASVPFRVVP